MIITASQMESLDDLSSSPHPSWAHLMALVPQSHERADTQQATSHPLLMYMVAMT